MLDENSIESLETGLSAGITGEEYKEELILSDFRVKSSRNPRDVVHKFVLFEDELRCVTDSDWSFLMSNILGCQLSEDNTNLKITGYETKKKSGWLCGSSVERLVRRELELSAVEGAVDSLRRLNAAIKWLAQGHSGKDLPESILNNSESVENLPLPRKRRLLIFLNPKSGTQRALPIWKKVVKPMLENDADIETQLLITEKQNHAKNYVQEKKGLASAFDGIIIVSGDGLLHEVLNGVMMREDWVACIRSMSFGIVPAGTGNGLATVLTKRSKLPSGTLASAFLCAKMKSRPMDIMAVDIMGHEKIERLYSFLSLEWGLMSFLDIDSERARFLGGFRFTVWAILGIILRRKYRGVLSYKEMDEEDKILEKYWDINSDYHAGSQEGLAPRTEFLPDQNESVPGVNVPWIATDANPRPDSSLDDGVFRMMYQRKRGRFDMARFMLGIEDGTGMNLKSAETFSTRALRLEPKDKKLGGSRYICIDGEAVEYTTLQMELLGSFMKVFCF